MPDTIILNVLLPGVTGYQLCRNLRMDPQLYTAGILFLTPFGEEPEVIHSNEQGADDCLAKPFKFDELRERLAALSGMSKRETERDPSTGLLGMPYIKREINHRLARGDTCAIYHVSIEGMKEYQVVLGADRCRDALQNISKMLAKVASDAGIYDSRIAHLGGQHFTVLLSLDDYKRYCSVAASGFNNILSRLHPENEVNPGSMSFRDEHGKSVEAPLLGIAISVAHSERRQLRNTKKVFEILTQTRKIDAPNGNDTVRVDRREARA